MDGERLSEAHFLVGANLPWISYGGDFGASAWHPDGGLAWPAVRARAGEMLRALADAGARVVRWFVLCDGRAGLRRDGGGRLAGLDERFFPDLDAAVDLLEKTGLRAVFVLLDFAWFLPASTVEGVQTGGRSRLIASDGVRARFLDTVLAPILDRYGDAGSIAAWDAVNEPEWATTRRPFLRRGRLPVGAMRALVRDVAALVHERTRQMVTCGCGSAASLALVRDLGLDFYQVHWYDRLPVPFDLNDHVDALRLDRPVVLGEFPTRGSRLTPAAILRAARSSGYAGAFAWSMVRKDAASDREALEAALAGVQHTVGRQALNAATAGASIPSWAT